MQRQGRGYDSGKKSLRQSGSKITGEKVRELRGQDVRVLTCVEVNNLKRISSCVINTEKPLLQCFSNCNVRKNHLEILVKCRIRCSRLTSSPVLLPLLLQCKGPRVAFEQRGCRTDLPCNCIQETIDKLCL